MDNRDEIRGRGRLSLLVFLWLVVLLFVAVAVYMGVFGSAGGNVTLVLCVLLVVCVLILTCLEIAFPPVIRPSSDRLLVRGRRQSGRRIAWAEISEIRIERRIPPGGVRMPPAALVVHRHGTSRVVAVPLDGIALPPKEIAEWLRSRAPESVPVTLS